MSNQVIIYDGAARGEVVQFKFDEKAETIWATVEQMAEVFEVDRTVIARHIRNIYNSGELSEAGTCAKNAEVRQEGERLVTRQVRRYNLDVIISVGYRVNSAKATKFRIWAGKVLKNYIVQGVAVNEARLIEVPDEKLKNIEGALSLVRRLMGRNELTAGEANGVLEVIAKYAESFEVLGEYERKKIVRLSRNFAQQKKFGEEEVAKMISELRASEGETTSFGRVENVEVFDQVLRILAGEEKGDVPAKAAQLLYLIAKGQPFSDGNKRIAALIFVVFLTFNDYNLAENGETKISDRALTALTLLMGESEESEKELLIQLVEKLLR